MNGTKVTDEYDNIFTILSITDNVVKVYEKPNDTIHASNLFLNGKSLLEAMNND